MDRKLKTYKKYKRLENYHKSETSENCSLEIP
jgi:hypothetical protein